MCQTSNLGVLTATSYRKEIGKLNLELHTVVCDIRCVMKEIRLVCNAEVDDDQDTDSASQASHSEEIHSQDPLPTYGNSSAGGLLSAVQEGPQPDGTVKDFESKACSSSDEDDTSKADAEAELIAKYSGLADGDSGKMVPASDLLAMMQVVNRNSDRLAELQSRRQGSAGGGSSGSTGPGLGAGQRLDEETGQLRDATVQRVRDKLAWLDGVVMAEMQRRQDSMERQESGM